MSSGCLWFSPIRLSANWSLSTYIFFTFQDFKHRDVICDDCKKLINDLKSQVLSEHSIQEIVSSLNQLVCEELPQSYRQICTSYVNEYVPVLMQFLVSEIVCSLHFYSRHTFRIHLRCADILVYVHWMFPTPWVLSLFPSPWLFLQAELTSPNLGCKHRRNYSWLSRPGDRAFWTSFNPLKGAAAPSCDNCKSVVNQFLSHLTDPSVQAASEKFMEKICDSFSFLRSEVSRFN